MEVLPQYGVLALPEVPKAKDASEGEQSDRSLAPAPQSSTHQSEAETVVSSQPQSHATCIETENSLENEKEHKPPDVGQQDRHEAAPEEVNHAVSWTAQATVTHQTSEYYNASQGDTLATSHTQEEEKLMLPSATSQPSVDIRDKTERMQAWNDFVKQHEAILAKRIQADEFRRRATHKRQAFVNMIKESFPIPSQGSTHDSSEGSSQILSLMSIVSELVVLEKQVEDIDKDLIHAESTIQKFTPNILGSEPNEAFEFLVEDLFFPPPDSESVASAREDFGSEPQPPAQRSSLVTKMNEVDVLEEQLLELREEHHRLRRLEEKDLNPAEKSFLESYDEKKLEVRNLLSHAILEIEELRNAQQSHSFIEDDLEEGSPSQLQAVSTESFPILDWLDRSTERPVPG